jgi:hypothetical protein
LLGFEDVHEPGLFALYGDDLVHDAGFSKPEFGRVVSVHVLQIQALVVRAVRVMWVVGTCRDVYL